MPLWKRLFNFLRHYFRVRFVPDLWSTLLSSAVGSAITIVTAVALAKEAPKEILVLPNDQGFAKPMQSLDRAIQRDEGPINVKYEPANLKDMVVCEFAKVSGHTGREMLFSYIERYPMCVRVFQVSETSYTLRPNETSGEMTSKNSQWFCRCPGVK